jgi:hypothetical protein
MNHADFDRFKLEILAWQERYFALVKEVANIEGMRRAPMMLADKESYELGRLHGATEEREACAKVCDARYMGDNNREDMEARRCAEAIRARGQP